MPEQVSPESKLYVKEEIEKSRKEVKEEVEKVNSKAAKTFTTVAVVVGLLTGLGVYGLAKEYIETTVKENLGSETLAKIEENKTKAQASYNKIVEYETEANSILSSLPYDMVTGTIVPYGGKIVETNPGEPTEVKKGWFFCNGASLDRKKYEDLYNVIGVAFGEPNSVTFNLPDLRGRFVRGVDHGTGRDPDAQSRKHPTSDQVVGDKVGSLQMDQLVSHGHQLKKPIYEHKRSFEGSDKYMTIRPLRSGPDAAEEWLKGTNPYGGKETRPKNIYVNWIIKAQ